VGLDNRRLDDYQKRQGMKIKEWEEGKERKGKERKGWMNKWDGS